MDLSYEERRQANIKRNAQVLAQLGVVEAAPKMEAPVEAPKRQRSRVQRSRAKAYSDDENGGDDQPTQSRRSARVRGEKVPNLSLEELERRQKIADVHEMESTDGSRTGLKDIFEYFGERGVFPTVLVDGQFHGWVKEEYISKFDLPASQQEQSEFEFNKKSLTKVSSSGWSSAKSRAYALFRRNPNTYFYRHKAPGEEQSTGEWDNEEYQTFLQTARKYGLGDRWGLFSSYIPGRVGYQCANYYRGNVLPKGIIYDANYMIDTVNGAALYAPHPPHPAIQKRLDTISDDNPVLILSAKESQALFAEIQSSSAPATAQPASKAAEEPDNKKSSSDSKEKKIANKKRQLESEKTEPDASTRPPPCKRTRRE